MKNSLVLFLALISIGSFAAEGKLLLSCEERFSSLTKIEFFQRRDGSLYGVQHTISANKNYSTEFNVNPVAFEKKTDIELVSWYGYERKLTFVSGNTWSIDYQDECGGGLMNTVCTEYK